jgi:hypothetical protein
MTLKKYFNTIYPAAIHFAAQRSDTTVMLPSTTAGHIKQKSIKQMLYADNKFYEQDR